MKNVVLLIFCGIVLLVFSGCGKKKTPLGTIPVPKIPKKIDLLPGVINVRYHDGVSGAESCRKCHGRIYSEWKESFHSQACSSEIFMKTSDKYQFESCMKCHSPLDFKKNDERPRQRKWKVHEGVTCSSCHVRGNRVIGTIGSNAPHKVKVDVDYKKSVVCQPCHQNTYKEWKQGNYDKQGLQCQTCHMPMVKRHIVSQAQKLYKVKDSHKHTFEIDFSKVVELKLGISRILGNQIRLEVFNKGAGHALPTGIYGDTELFIQFNIYDQDRSIFFREEKLSAMQKNSIKPNGVKEFIYNFKPPVKKSYLMEAKVFFSSSNHGGEVKIGEIKKYYDAAKITKY
jgi:hypothetical protein